MTSTTRLELFTEVEPGTTIWHFDQTDIREAKKALGDVAPGGGLRAPDEAEDANVRAMIQAAKDYGVY